MVQTQVTAQGWLGSTPEGRRPQIPGPFHFPIEDDASSTDFSQWNMAHSLPPASLAIDHSSLATCHSPLATRHYSKPFLLVPSGVNPAELRTVKLSPACLMSLRKNYHWSSDSLS